MRQSTITINGRLYDALSGQPVASNTKAAAQVAQAKPPAPVASKASQHNIRAPRPKHPAATVHAKPQRSTTLNRIAVQKPQPQAATAHSKSPLISRFGPAAVSPQPNTTPSPQVTPQTPPAQSAPPNTTPLHPSVMAAMRNRMAASHTNAPQSSKELKEALMRERLAEVGNEQPAKPSLFARRPKLASILASTLSLLILGGYFTYINLTNISMRVAASSAGINASFPGYRPDGYSVNGPITYAPGEVTINYKSNTSDSGFALTQKTSSWDSQGVLDNYVRKQTSTYLTFQQRGVTVYTFNNKAAWTNGGLLYTIEGDASLSSDQILRLATSL